VKIDVSPVPLEEALPLRERYRREMNCQIVHDSLPGRGFGDMFLIRADDRVAGYGFVMGYRGEPKDMIQEFHNGVCVKTVVVLNEESRKNAHA
jgi:hypothetical protein